MGFPCIRVGLDVWNSCTGNDKCLVILLCKENTSAAITMQCHKPSSTFKKFGDDIQTTWNYVNDIIYYYYPNSSNKYQQHLLKLYINVHMLYA